TSRFSSCRQMMSAACTRASCTCAEMTARSSASSAISFNGAGDMATTLASLAAERLDRVDILALQHRLRIAIARDLDHGAAELLAGRHVLRRHTVEVRQQR